MVVVGDEGWKDVGAGGETHSARHLNLFAQADVMYEPRQITAQRLRGRGRTPRFYAREDAPLYELIALSESEP